MAQNRNRNRDQRTWNRGTAHLSFDIKLGLWQKQLGDDVDEIFPPFHIYFKISFVPYQCAVRQLSRVNVGSGEKEHEGKQEGARGRQEEKGGTLVQW